MISKWFSDISGDIEHFDKATLVYNEDWKKGFLM